MVDFDHDKSAEAANARKTYRGQCFWPVLYGVTLDIEADSPEQAMEKLKQYIEDDVHPDYPDTCFFEHAESFDNSDGDNSLEVWDESMREVLLSEHSDESRLGTEGAAMLAALEAIVFQVCQGKVLERDACITQARAAIAAAKGGSHG